MRFLRDGNESERRSSRWDESRGAGNFAGLVGAQVLGAVLSFAALLLATRALGPEGYGRIVALIALSFLVSQFTIQWTAISVFRYGCEEFVETGRIARSFWNRLAILGVNLSLALLLSPWWLPPVGRWLGIPASTYGLVLAHLITTALAGHVQQSLQAAKLPRLSAALQIVERGALALILLVLLASGQARWAHVALAFALTPLVSFAGGLFRLRHLVYPGVSLDPRAARHILHFSFPLILYSAVGYLGTNHVDAFFVLRYLSEAEVGIYNVAYQLAGTFMQLPALAGSLFFAFFLTMDASRDSGKLRRFFSDVLPVFTLLWSFAASLAAALGSLLVTWFFGGSFEPARALLWPLMAAAGLAGPVMLALGPTANARSRTGVPALAAALAAAVNVGLNIVLIPRFGLLGCAWATASSFAVSLFVCTLLVPPLVPASRSWTFLATLPAVVGAAVAAASPPVFALAASAVVTAVLALLKRRAMAYAWHAVESNTGPHERQVLDEASPWWSVHVARYRFARPFARGRRVVDVASGTGYGIHELSGSARAIVGVDLDIDSVKAAAARARGIDESSLLVADARELPFEDESFDLAISFETIEHLRDRDRFCRELARVLEPEGLLILSTPNAKHTRPPNGVPVNPFHVHEYEPDELRSELEKAFASVELIGQSLDSRFAVPPFWDEQERLAREGRRGRGRVLLWRALYKLPRPVGDGLSELFLKHPVLPGVEDYRFEEMGESVSVSVPPVILALCRGPLKPVRQPDVRAKGKNVLA